MIKNDNTTNASSLNATQLSEKIQHHLGYTLGDIELKQKLNTDCEKTKQAYWQAIALAVNDIALEKLNATKQQQLASQSKCINYLSLEYLMGRLLSNNLHNLDLYHATEQAVKSLGFELADLCEQGADLALGNGGLGRLAACFLDSLATLDYNAMGYGIHYRHGLFAQHFEDGKQIEEPDLWCEFGSPWEVCRQESSQLIPIYGTVADVEQADGSTKAVWTPSKMLQGIPYDVPIVGYQSNTVNALRLWECRADSAMDWDTFSRGEYVNALEQQVMAETVSKVLYPNDEHQAGQELRFVQQYFFCACSIRDIISRYQAQYGELNTGNSEHFASKVAVQLNDTHPTLAILEFMRLLTDEYQFSWDDAWALARKVFAYTNHTLLPEALEKWSVALFTKVLPRHLSILYRINEEFLNNEVAKVWPNDQEMRAKLSLIEEGDEKKLRMAHLCVVASHKVNGVAQIHSDLVKSDLFPEFDQLWPEKLTNVTNGITPRRWLKACNPALSNLLSEHIDCDWAKDLDALSALTAKANDEDFQQRFMAIKHENKKALAQEILALTGVEVSPDAIFDIQIKRLHEYKRQHLNLLHIIALYRRLLANPDMDFHPQVFIFGAKAYPSYKLAKEIIYATNKVAEKINNDERINGKLKVVFLPNYRVSLAEKIIPAADVSEQISTAGKEASGTGNMKLALNGAITIGTLDGANVEIAEEVGDDNIFIFGLTVEQVKALNEQGYNPREYYQANKELKEAIDLLNSDYFTPGKANEFSMLVHALLDGGDYFKALADFEAYSKAQQALNKAYQNKKRWARMAIMNTALMGKFNSDRSIKDYVTKIWHLDK